MLTHPFAHRSSGLPASVAHRRSRHECVCRCGALRCHAQLTTLSLFARHSHPASFLRSSQYEHQVLPKQNAAGDLPPAFHEWATIQPGMIVLARKKRTAQYRQFHAAETAMPVIGCAECLGPSDEPNFFFGMLLRHKFARHFSRILIGSPRLPLSRSGRVPVEDGPGTRRWHWAFG